MNFPVGKKWLRKVVPVVAVPTIVMLTTAGLFVACNDTYIPPATKHDLVFTISDAIRTLRLTNEGSAAGFQIRGSRKVFIDSIRSAQLIVVDSTIRIVHGVTDSIRRTYTPFKQVRIDLANSNLRTAIANYKSQTVKEIDPVNLVAQYTFENLSSSDVGELVKDYSGKGHDGVLAVGSTNWGRGVPAFGTDRYGIFGRALYFNYGANIEIPYSSDLNPSAITISYWAKATGYTTFNRQYVVSLNRADGYKTVGDGSARVNFTVNPAATPGSYINEYNPDAWVEGVWRHFAFTFGNGFMRIYVDGKLVKEAAHSGTLYTLPTPVNLTIGQDLPTSAYSSNPVDPHYVNNGGYYIGYIDEVRIYKTVLTASQITSIYTLEKY